MIYTDDEGYKYNVAPVTSENSWLRDDLWGFEGQGYIVCKWGDFPFEEAQMRFSEAKAEQDLESIAKKHGWHKVDELTDEQRKQQELEMNDFLKRELEKLQPELY